MPNIEISLSKNREYIKELPRISKDAYQQFWALVERYGLDNARVEVSVPDRFVINSPAQNIVERKIIEPVIVRPVPAVYDATVRVIRSEWQRFYKEVFDWDVDLSNIPVPVDPGGFPWIIYNLLYLSLFDLFTACIKQFNGQFWSFTDNPDQDIPTHDRDPNNVGAYAIRCRDRVEADEENKELSVGQATGQEEDSHPHPAGTHPIGALLSLEYLPTGQAGRPTFGHTNLDAL